MYVVVELGKNSQKETVTHSRIVIRSRHRAPITGSSCSISDACCFRSSAPTSGTCLRHSRGCHGRRKSTSCLASGSHCQQSNTSTTEPFPFARIIQPFCFPLRAAVEIKEAHLQQNGRYSEGVARHITNHYSDIYRHGL